MTKSVRNLFTKSFLPLLAGMLSLFAQAQSGAPELVFHNPVLTSGLTNTEGAVYRFSNVTDFAVFLKNTDAVLNWKATQDEKLSHFLIQRSTDGITYTNIAVVFAGASAAYTFKDKNPNVTNGVVYYRVTAIDQTKETSVSAVKTVRLTRPEAASFTIAASPNPVVGGLRISLPRAWHGKAVRFDVYNANGVLAKTTETAHASQTEIIALNTITKGLYVIKATCGGEAAAQRIVKN